MDRRPARLPRPATLVVASLFGAIAAFSASPAPSGSVPGPGTRKMAARLETLAKEAVPLENPWFGGARAEALLAQLKGVTDQKQYLRLQSMYATELLNSGKSLEAIQALTTLQKFVADKQIHLSDSDQTYLSVAMGLSHLRLGELENCLARHSTVSCLLPIRGRGIHAEARG